MRPVFVLVHSPSVGPSTWRPVAEHLTAAGYQVRVPSLLHIGSGDPPFWPRVADAVHEDLRQVPVDSPVTLVAHSNAGLFLPAIRSRLDHPVAASVFVDAPLPARFGPTPVATPEFLDFLGPMAVNGRLPRWTDWWAEEDIAPMFSDSDPAQRQKITEEQPRLPLSYYEQHIPVPQGWDDHPCSYLLFGPPYDAMATEARTRGWQVAHLPGEHLHQIIAPAATTKHLVTLAATP
ncbi:alpha/beta hydrolase [Streptomyces sp. NPDC058067]|uniref:alpha/beta hydrolase n=1 Tax=Streptomyces sp. NPDC058067 TaxID=3346324 RepID=UPI0036EECD9B